MTDLSLTLSERHTADFEMIANGGFAPLDRLPGRRRLAARLRGDAPGRRRLLADPDHPRHRPRLLRRRRRRPLLRRGQAAGPPHGRGDLRARRAQREAEQVYRTTDDDHPGVAAIYEEGDRCLAGPIEADALPDHEERVHAPLPDPGGVAQGVRRPRLEQGRRLPDPQPDPPRPRVPHQGGAGDLRRALHPPADRQDQGRRHPRRRADALLRGPDGELLPAATG